MNANHDRRCSCAKPSNRSRMMGPNPHPQDEEWWGAWAFEPGSSPPGSHTRGHLRIVRKLPVAQPCNLVHDESSDRMEPEHLRCHTTAPTW